MNRIIYKNKKGFTLIESLVSLGIFMLLTGVIYGTVNGIVKQVIQYRENTSVSALADQYMEIARNLPYSKVGTVNGNPPGNLPDYPNAITAIFNKDTYKIYYVVNYVDDPADGTIVLGTDPAPNDYKQIKLYIQNASTNITKSFLTNISPKGLENINNAGALMIHVFDAVGQPVPYATINILNTALTPDINLTRTTDSNGYWVEVGLPDSNNSYDITATKTGYSTDSTYPIVNGTNPSPTKPDATISNGQVTQVSFSIDLLSNLTFTAVNPVCSPVSGASLIVKGAKLIGTPSVLKYTNTFSTDSFGNINLNNIEWDNYTPTLSSASYMVYGSSPIQQISLLPNTSQQFNFILGTKTTNALLVIVKESATGNAIKDATVTLSNTSPATTTTRLTDGNIWGQSNWTGGAGQQTMGASTMYFADDGNITTNVVPLGLRLLKTGSVYSSSGNLTSSTFDTGTASTSYTTISWLPTSQSASTTAKFQIASSNTNTATTTWNYLGPDGTAATYYTVPGTTISSVHNGNQYVRYKAYLSTTNTAITPVITSLIVNYVSGCFTPGQAMFAGLTSAGGYQITVDSVGYQSKTVTGLTISGYNTLQVLLNP